jgi:hypothetical protein
MGTDLPGYSRCGSTAKQQSHYLRDMDDPNKKRLPKKALTADDLHKKITALEKQLEWEKLRGDALDTMIDIAEEKLNISIRKKVWQPTVRQIKKTNSYVSPLLFMKADTLHFGMPS